MSQINIHFGGYQPSRSVHSRAARVFGEALKRALGANIGFCLTEDVTRAGRRASDLPAMVEANDLELCYFSSSYLAGRVPSLNLFDLPFQFSDREAAFNPLNGELGECIAMEVASATGLRVLAYWDNGFRHISNWRHAILRPEDCHGLTIRTLDNSLHQSVFRSLGFEPLFIDVRDLAVAVANHAVDAQENPLTNLVSFNLHKTHRFVSLTSHLLGVALVLCNRAHFDRWPEPIRTGVRHALAVATAAQRRFATEDDAACLAQLAADGVEIAGPDDIDRAAFVAAVAGVVDAARAQLGDLQRFSQARFEPSRSPIEP